MDRYGCLSGVTLVGIPASFLEQRIGPLSSGFHVKHHHSQPHGGTAGAPGEFPLQTMTSTSAGACPGSLHAALSRRGGKHSMALPPPAQRQTRRGARASGGTRAYERRSTRAPGRIRPGYTTDHHGCRTVSSSFPIDVEDPTSPPGPCHAQGVLAAFGRRRRQAVGLSRMTYPGGHICKS